MKNFHAAMTRPFLHPLARYKSYGRSAVRAAVYWWIDRSTLTETRAAYWLTQFKRWPAIFDEDPYTRSVLIAPNTRMRVGLVDFIERNLALYRSWDAKVLGVLEQHLKPGDTFIDIGANIGYFTLMGSRLVGEKGCVIALEPSIRALAKLTQNLRMNDTKNVILLSLACGKSKNLKSLYQASIHNIGETSMSTHMGTAPTETIISLPLDDILQQLNIMPSMIKIDIEGYEFEALQGMSNILKNFRPTIVTEITPRWLEAQGRTAGDVHDYMDQHGYDCFLIGEDGSWTHAMFAKDLATIDGQAEVLFLARDLKSAEVTVGP